MQQLDLASLASIRACATQLLGSLPRLDLLILNAGVMACAQSTTADGFEMQVGARRCQAGSWAAAGLQVPGAT